MTIDEAVAQCRAAGLSGWELVAYAQHLVAGYMSYSWFHSLESPEQAFIRGEGYCWQQAGALNRILAALGFDSRLVHAIPVLVPDTVIGGVRIPAHKSGHVWCRVRLDGEEKDVCPGNRANSPGVVHFSVPGGVYDYKGLIVPFGYFGSALINWRRGRKYMERKAKQAILHDPKHCPCKKVNCPRNKNCAACQENHHANGSKTTCERLAGK